MPTYFLLAYPTGRRLKKPSISGLKMANGISWLHFQQVHIEETETDGNLRRFVSLKPLKAGAGMELRDRPPLWGIQVAGRAPSFFCMQREVKSLKSLLKSVNRSK